VVIAQGAPADVQRRAVERVRFLRPARRLMSCGQACGDRNGIGVLVAQNSVAVDQDSLAEGDVAKRWL
jgi:hypothetical protein